MKRLDCRHSVEPAFEEFFERLRAGPVKRRRGRPRDGFARASMHNRGVREIMRAENVGITRAVGLYARAIDATTDHIWVALRNYWRVMEADSDTDEDRSKADDDDDSEPAVPAE